MQLSDKQKKKIQELKDKKYSLEEIGEEMKDSILEVEQQIADLSSPFKVGDIGIIQGNRCHHYKGAKAKISKISYRSMFGNWKCTAVLYKQNGELGPQEVIIIRTDEFELI